MLMYYFKILVRKALIYISKKDNVIGAIDMCSVVTNILINL